MEGVDEATGGAAAGFELLIQPAPSGAVQGGVGLGRLSGSGNRHYPGPTVQAVAQASRLSRGPQNQVNQPPFVMVASGQSCKHPGDTPYKIAADCYEL